MTVQSIVGSQAPSSRWLWLRNSYFFFFFFFGKGKFLGRLQARLISKTEGFCNPELLRVGLTPADYEALACRRQKYFQIRSMYQCILQGLMLHRVCTQQAAKMCLSVLNTQWDSRIKIIYVTKMVKQSRKKDREANKIGKKGRTKAQREKNRIRVMGEKRTVRHTN